jgi:hypothetical protein
MLAVGLTSRCLCLRLLSTHFLPGPMLRPTLCYLFLASLQKDSMRPWRRLHFAAETCTRVVQACAPHPALSSTLRPMKACSIARYGMLQTRTKNPYLSSLTCFRAQCRHGRSLTSSRRTPRRVPCPLYSQVHAVAFDKGFDERCVVHDETGTGSRIHAGVEIQCVRSVHAPFVLIGGIRSI